MLGECPIGMQTVTRAPACDIEKFPPLALAYAMAAFRLASSSEFNANRARVGWADELVGQQQHTVA
jgi:hypothetical protein